MHPFNYNIWIRKATYIILYSSPSPETYKLIDTIYEDGYNYSIEKNMI